MWHNCHVTDYHSGNVHTQPMTSKLHTLCTFSWQGIQTIVRGDWLAWAHGAQHSHYEQSSQLEKAILLLLLLRTHTGSSELKITAQDQYYHTREAQVCTTLMLQSSFCAPAWDKTQLFSQIKRSGRHKISVQICLKLMAKLQYPFMI